jgi:hypothetical protein
MMLVLQIHRQNLPGSNHLIRIHHIPKYVFPTCGVSYDFYKGCATYGVPDDFYKGRA